MTIAEMPVDKLDLDSVAQRILALTELATQEHLKSLSRSQADRLVEMVRSESADRRQTLVARR